MYPGKIQDILRINALDIAKNWLDKVRHANNLKHCARLSDLDLLDCNLEFYPTLAGWFDGETDRNKLGAFFVKLGKDRFKDGFPVSELVYALLLSQRAVLEYLLSQAPPENSMDLYRSVELTTQVSEFFMLGSFYLTKGFLEDAYLALSKGAGISEELLRGYFTDDFFFKSEG